MLAIHTGDAMEDDTTYFPQTGLSGLPTGNLSRVQTKVDPQNWSSYINSMVTTNAVAKVSVSRSYNPSTRELSITVSSKFSQAVAGTYGLGLVIAEDGVQGPAPQYNQSNSYSGGSNGPMGGYEDLPSPVPASLMVYDHVARKLVTSYTGDGTVVPANPVLGVAYSKTFTYILPAHLDETYTYAIGYLTNTSGAIVNAAKSPYAVGSYNAPPLFKSTDTVYTTVGASFMHEVLCHDPDDTSLVISSSNLPAWLSLTKTSGVEALLSGTPTVHGNTTVTINASDGNASTSQDLVIIVTQALPGGSWNQLGSQGFSQDKPKYEHGIAVDRSTGITYTFELNGNDQMNVYKYDNGSWSVIGNKLPAYDLYADIDVNPATNEVNIFYKDPNSNTGYVKSYTGGSWVTVGGGISNVSNGCELAFATDGTPYVAFGKPQGTGLNVQYYDGSAWVDLTSAPAFYSNNYWPRLKMGANNTLVLMTAEFPSNYSPHTRVHKFDGANWVALGGLLDSNNTSSASGNAHSLAVSASTDDIYAAVYLYHESKIVVYKWNGTDWFIINPSLGNGAVGEYDIAVGVGNQVNAIYKNGTSALNCEKYDGTAWSNVGNPGFTPTVGGDIMMDVYSNGNPVVCYGDMSMAGKLSVKHYGYGPVNIEEHREASVLSAYPNPFTDNVTINIPGQNEWNYLVIDITGRTIASGNIKNGQSIDLSNCTEGVYVLHLESNGFVRSIKIIK